MTHLTKIRESGFAKDASGQALQCQPRGLGTSKAQLFSVVYTHFRQGRNIYFDSPCLQATVYHKASLKNFLAVPRENVQSITTRVEIMGTKIHFNFCHCLNVILPYAEASRSQSPSCKHELVLPHT